MSEIDLQELRKPFSKQAIKWRVGSMTKDKKKTKPLAYIDARDVMARLDAVCGISNWQDTYVGYGNRIICSLSIKINGEWVTKSDGAGETAVEGDKGGISDAFKRAAVKWGVGRHLYSLKCKWMPVDDYKQIVGDPWKNLENNGLLDEVARREALVSYINQFRARLDKCQVAKQVEMLITQDDKYLKRMKKDYPEDYDALMDSCENRKIEISEENENEQARFAGGND